MNKLEYGLKLITDRNRDGSFATQANRRSMLRMFTAQLKDCGYVTREMRPSDLKGRHINALLTKWKAEDISTATIKNRMAVLRWWAEKVGKAEIVKENDVYGIAKRVYVTNADKSISLENIDLTQLSPEIAQSLRLQTAFGLRREESMKFQPEYALAGQKIADAQFIKIKGSWAKGGRDREIPITTADQRQQLTSAFALAQSGSMIPANKSYKAHLASFEVQTRDLGIGRTHGLRHGYAQARYFELTGMQCPAVEGNRQLTPEQREIDVATRLKISEELGHSRINITSLYLGSWSAK